MSAWTNTPFVSWLCFGIELVDDCYEELRGDALSCWDAARSDLLTQGICH
jgi:hypothetical protein